MFSPEGNRNLLTPETMNNKTQIPRGDYYRQNDPELRGISIHGNSREHNI